MLTNLATASMNTLLAQAAAAPDNLIWLGVVFFVIAIIAYVLGARGVAGMSAGLGRTLLIVGVVLAIVIIVFGYVGHQTYKSVVLGTGRQCRATLATGFCFHLSLLEETIKPTMRTLKWDFYWIL